MIDKIVDDYIDMIIKLYRENCKEALDLCIKDKMLLTVFDSLPDEIKNNSLWELKRSYFLKMRSFQKKAFLDIEKISVESFYIKGKSISKYYCDEMMRQMSDIDLCVSNFDDFLIAVEELESLGYKLDTAIYIKYDDYTKKLVGNARLTMKDQPWYDIIEIHFGGVLLTDHTFIPYSLVADRSAFHVLSFFCEVQLRKSFEYRDLLDAYFLLRNISKGEEKALLTWIELYRPFHIIRLLRETCLIKNPKISSFIKKVQWRGVDSNFFNDIYFIISKTKRRLLKRLIIYFLQRISDNTQRVFGKISRKVQILDYFPGAYYLHKCNFICAMWKIKKRCKKNGGTTNSKNYIDTKIGSFYLSTRTHYRPNFKNGE